MKRLIDLYDDIVLCITEFLLSFLQEPNKFWVLIQVSPSPFMNRVRKVGWVETDVRHSMNDPRFFQFNNKTIGKFQVLSARLSGDVEAENVFLIVCQTAQTWLELQRRCDGPQEPRHPPADGECGVSHRKAGSNQEDNTEPRAIIIAYVCEPKVLDKRLVAEKYQPRCER